MSQPSAVSQPAKKLWTIDFVLNLLTGHFLFASYSAVLIIVPPYVLDRGGEEWQIGIVVGSFGLFGIVVRPFAGRWIYHLGAKRIAFIGLSVFAIATVLYIPAFSVWWLVPVRVLQGSGMAMAPVATSTIVANLAPANRRAEAMAYMGNSISVSSLYSPVLSYWLFSHFGFASTFLFATGCAVLGALLALPISAAGTSFPASQGSSDRVPLINRAALFPTAVFLSITLSTAPISSFLPLLAEDRQLGNPGLFFTVNSFTTMFVMLLAGPVADRVGRASVIIPGLLSTAASMFLLMVASNQAMFLGAAFLTGVGFGMIQPGIQSLAIDRVPPRERASAVATLQAAWDVGGSGGAFVLGPIGGAFNVASTFGIVGVGALMGAAGFIVGNTRSRTPLPSESVSGND